MEYIQADIWVRTQRMYGHTVHFVGADDTHGAPMMIAAQKKGSLLKSLLPELQPAAKPTWMVSTLSLTIGTRPTAKKMSCFRKTSISASKLPG